MKLLTLVLFATMAAFAQKVIIEFDPAGLFWKWPSMKRKPARKKAPAKTHFLRKKVVLVGRVLAGIALI